MMKRLLAIIMCVVLAASFCACDVNISTSSSSTTSNSATSTEPAQTQSTSAQPKENEQSNTAKDKISYPEPQANYDSLHEVDFSKYKLIMINYWRPTCGFCVEEMPDLERIWENYKDKGVLVIGVSTEKEDVEATVSETGVTYPIIVDEVTVDSSILEAMPQTAFYNSDGNMLPAQNSEVGDPAELINRGHFIGSDDYDTWAKRVDLRLGGKVAPDTSSNIFSSISASAGSDDISSHEFFEKNVTSVMIANDLMEPITGFYMKPSHSDNWGENYIRSGGSYSDGEVSFVTSIIHTEEGFMHDIIIQTKSGLEYTVYNVDLSKASDTKCATIYARYNNGEFNIVVD